MLTPKEIQLRKHKLIATALFFLMALIYAAMVYLQHHNPQTWMGYVEAFSEAGMVGALADWFAVTALFRHPLGLPIPHTNLIERKKNDLGDNLGMFVKDNFLNPQTIRPYIVQLDVVSFASKWLIKTENQTILEEEFIRFIEKILTDLKEDQVVNFISLKAADIIKTINYRAIASEGIVYLIERNEHNRLLDSILPQLKIYVHESQEMIRERISDNKPFIAFLAGKRISKELTDGLIAFIEEIQQDENHFLRHKIHDSLVELAQEMENSPQWEEKFNEIKNGLIVPEKIQPYASDAWKSIQQKLKDNLSNSESLLRQYLRKNISKIAHDLENDQTLQTKINGWIRHFIYRLILRNRNEFQNVISNTVANWEGKELSNKLELEVGKDLQFIRINGTLVGGLVGLIIFTITQFFTK